MLNHNLIFAALLICFSACQSTQSGSSETPTTSSPEISSCVRGEAQPALDSTGLSHYSFTMLDSIQAEERWTLPNGDQWIIRHLGCEYFVIEYELRTQRHATPLSDTTTWTAHALEFTLALAEVDTSPMHLDTAAAQLETLVQSGDVLQPNIPYTLVPGEIQEEMQLSELSQDSTGTVTLRLVFAIGPL